MTKLRINMAAVIKDYGPNDPIPDLANQYRIGDVITMPDGRCWRRAALAQWELVSDAPEPPVHGETRSS